MKIKKKILYVILITIALVLFTSVNSKAGSLNLNNLDFIARINSDGSMNVKEIWDISINDTNTLYKTFETDSSKYSGIDDVSVKEITDGQETYFIQDDAWSYHAPKNHYYGTENSDGDFEIGWGVSLENKSAIRQYEISYTVNDAITKYNDYAELYWQFVGRDFEVDANKITGTIYLPENVSNQDDIKVWGHTKALNGTIYATGTNKIEFELNKFRSGTYVEVRTLFPSNQIINTKRVKNRNILETAISEETEWADKANEERARQEWIEKNIGRIIKIVFFGVNALLIFIYTKKAIKYKKTLKELNKYKPTVDYEYFREIPDENATPGEASLIINDYYDISNQTYFGKIFSATMLDLALKGYIELNQEGTKKNNVNIKVLKQDGENLKTDEKLILKFILAACKNSDNVITLKELEKYITNHPTNIESLILRVASSAKTQLVNEKILDNDNEKLYKKYKEKQSMYIVATIFSICFTFMFLTIPAIIFIYNAVITGKIAKRINVLTQKGVDSKAQWKGLKKFMMNFSMLDKREVPELVIWEKYLVYATAFGIADKVIKQLKIVYPNFEEMTNDFATYSCMRMMMTTNFSSSFSNAISSSISSAYSSGSGSGGGFSGGGGFGGGRRRRRRQIGIEGRS